MNFSGEEIRGQVLKSGSCEIVTSIASDLQSNLSVFPNPTSGLLNINSDYIIELVNVYSAEGRIIKSLTPNTGSINNIDLNGFSSGVYFVQVSTAGGINTVAMALVMIAAANNLNAQDNVFAGGMPMYPTKNIIVNAVNSKDHTTLVAAVKAPSLVDALQGDGPFTVFAPTNDAFENLPAGTIETLLKKRTKISLPQFLLITL